MKNKQVRKQKVEIYLHDDGSNLRLLVKTPDGVERFVDIFSGSGYYEAIWLRTAKEIEESRVAHEKNEREWIEASNARHEAREEKKWYQFFWK